MSLHADALTALRAWRAPSGAHEAEQEALRSAYVAHLAARPDGTRRGCYPDHLTASTLVLSADRSHALLTLHRKARAWFQLGGHLEETDATLSAAALREATEESGLEGLVLDPVPVHLDRHRVPFCDPRGGVRHLDVRFLAQAPDGVEHQRSEESLDLRWWPLDALPTDEPSILALVDLALDRAARRTGPGPARDR